MKRKPARFGVLLVAIAGLLATTVPSTQATTRKTIAFTGTAVLSSFFGNACATPPGTTACTGSTVSTKLGPKPGTVVINNTPAGGNTANFGFSSISCVKASTSTLKTGVANKNGVDQCGMSATGTLTGYCNFATGTLTATIRNLTGIKTDVTLPIKFTQTNDTAYFTGGGPTENIVGEANFDPTPGTGSCANGTATHFTITGFIEYKKCTTAATCLPV